jgi:hypothetical protein
MAEYVQVRTKPNENGRPYPPGVNDRDKSSLSALPGAVMLPAPGPVEPLERPRGELHKRWTHRSSSEETPSFKKRHLERGAQSARLGYREGEADDGVPKRPPGRDNALMVIFGVCVVDGLAQALTYPVMPFFVEQLGGDSKTLGFMFATFSAFATVASAVSGWLSDKVGRRPVLLCSLLGTSLSMFLSGQAKTIGWLFAARALLGLFAGTVPVAAAYIADIARPTERTKLLSLTGLATGVSYAWGPAFGSALARVRQSHPLHLCSALLFGRSLHGGSCPCALSAACADVCGDIVVRSTRWTFRSTWVRPPPSSASSLRLRSCATRSR